MGIFGSIAGGALGFIAGGPIGLVIGAALGAQVSLEHHPLTAGTHANAQTQAQAIFAVALTSLAAKVAKADGRVTKDEIEAYDRFLKKNMRMSVSEREHAASVFNEARANDTPASDYARQLGVLLYNQRDRLLDIVTILFIVADADGVQHVSEVELIHSIARNMGLSDEEFNSCRANFGAVRGEPKVSPYEVLGVEKGASDADVRAAHRRLVREYHPDVLQSKGMPLEYMEFAKEKLMAANESWSKIKEERGL